MAVQQLQLPVGSPINNTVDQASWSTLGNLGNVYQQAQDRARMQTSLAALGTDPIANSQVLIKSGVPELAQLGVQMQNRLASQAEDVRQFNLSLGVKQQEEAVREQQAALVKRKYEEDSPEFRGKQLDDMIAQGTLPPEAKKDPAWRAWQMTGQNIPSASIVAPQTAADRKAIREADQQVEAIGQSIQQIDTLKENIGKAWHLGPLTGPVGYATSFLPEGYGGTAGAATELASNEALKSMIGQVKAAFGTNPSNKEDAWLLKAQASIDKAAPVQQQILSEAKDLLIERQRFARDQARELRPGGNYYTQPPPMPGAAAPAPAATAAAGAPAPAAAGAPAPAAAPAPAPAIAPAAPVPAPTPAPVPVRPAAPIAAPSLSEFMVKARAANPGASDSELANYWNEKYGKKTKTAKTASTGDVTAGWGGPVVPR